MKKEVNILIINGVNLNKLGTREINIYGNVSFDEYLSELKEKFSMINFEHFQSDVEGEIADRITSATNYDSIILNAGAYTHTSLIIADAVRSNSIPTIEVHISNLFGREQYRKNSALSSVCAGFISGFGLQSYELAIYSILSKKNKSEIKLYKI